MGRLTDAEFQDATSFYAKANGIWEIRAFSRTQERDPWVTTIGFSVADLLAGAFSTR
jgi:hypothetical protein